MLYFQSDYMEGACSEIIAKLTETNFEPMSGYGNDPYCDSAKEKIRKACGREEAQVEFLTGGTQTNAVVIDSCLRSYEGVIAAETGHIALHEAGAIEHSGHKVLTIPGKNGKLAASDLKSYLELFYRDESHEHMVQPGMVYISHPTEYGTLYTAEELKELYALCREYDLPLYVDGARLGYALAAEGTDVTLPLLARYSDIFYIGGTKVGALCGEAVVFTRGTMPRAFLTIRKQHGGLLAKGRLLGIQFDTLFTDGLYEKLGRHAIRMAARLKEIFREMGYSFYLDSPTNQQFVILSNEEMERLKQNVLFSYWEPYDSTHTVVRFAVSWATREEDVEALKGYLSGWNAD